MRILKVLLLSMVVALAGCAGDDDDGGAQPPAGDGGALPGDGVDGGANETNETPDDGANETEETEEPAPPAPAEVHSSTHDFSQSATEDSAEPFTVPEGHSTLYLNVTFTPTGVGVANSASVTITGPGGGSATCTPSSPLTEAEECSQEVPSEAGDWTLTYSGSGTFSAAVSVTAV